MLRGARRLAPVRLTASLGAWEGGAGPRSPGTPSLTSQLVAEGFRRPLDLQAAPATANGSTWWSKESGSRLCATGS